MKRSLLLLAFTTSILFFACKKDDDTSGGSGSSNSMAGNWTIAKYDGQAVTAPMFGTYKTTATSTTAGTAAFVISFNGTTNNKENDTYVLSASNTKIDFTKTDGDFNVLAGGGTWTINTLDDHNLKMTSSFGLVLEMTK